MLEINGRPHLFTLDEQGEPVPATDVHAWAKQFEKSQSRIVAWNFYGGQATSDDYDIHISTVFLGSDHNFSGEGPAILWETMVFAEQALLDRLRELSETDDRSIFSQAFGGVDIQKRYASKAEALQGHKTMCEFVEVCIAKGLVTVRG